MVVRSLECRPCIWILKVSSNFKCRISVVQKFCSEYILQKTTELSLVQDVNQLQRCRKTKFMQYLKQGFKFSLVTGEFRWSNKSIRPEFAGPYYTIAVHKF